MKSGWKKASAALAALFIGTSSASAATINVNVQIDMSTNFVFGTSLQTAVQSVNPFSISSGDMLVTTFSFVNNYGVIYQDPTGSEAENFEIHFTGGNFGGVSGLNTLNITSSAGDLDDPTEGPDNIGFAGDIRQAVFGDFTDTQAIVLGGTLSTQIGVGGGGPHTYDGFFLRASPQGEGQVFAQTPISGTLPLLASAVVVTGVWRYRRKEARKTR
jgi:hypothetical protein